MARRRCILAERERDITVEEAAAACYELSALKDEVVTLRQEKTAWEAGKDAWSQRHHQILWHVGYMAEVLWHAMVQNDGQAAPTLSIDEAKLLALQTLEQITSKSDAQLCEEMHDLYTKVADMEAQQSRLIEKMRELKTLNEVLITQNPERSDQERIKHLVQIENYEKVELQRAATLTSNFDVEESAQASEAAATSSSTNMRDKSEAVYPANLAESLPVVELLQAQLAMYVRYARRHGSARTQK